VDTESSKNQDGTEVKISNRTPGSDSEKVSITAADLAAWPKPWAEIK
jgi:hypothetical protein